MAGASASGGKRGKSGRSALLAKARAQGGGSESQHNTPQSRPAPGGVEQARSAASVEGVVVLGKEEELGDRAAAFGFITDSVLKNANPIAAQLLKYPLPPNALLPEHAFSQKCGRGCRCRVSLPSDGTTQDSSYIPSLDRYAITQSGKKRKGSQGNGSGLWGPNARSNSASLKSPEAVKEVQKLKASRLLGPDHEEPSHLGSKVPYIPPSFPDARAQAVPTLASLLPSYSRFFVTLTPNCPHLPNVAAAAEHTLRTTVAQEALAAGQAALNGGAGPHSGLGIPGLRQGLQQQQHQQQQGAGNAGAPWGGAPPVVGGGVPQSGPPFVAPSWFDGGSGSFVKPPWEAHAPNALAALALHMNQWQKH